MKKALVVSALCSFAITFLKNDIRILQEMGYEVHVAANGNSYGIEHYTAAFRDQCGAEFHHVNFSSSNPLAKGSLKVYRQLKKMIRDGGYDLIHCHTPIAGIWARLAARGARKKGAKVIYTTHGFSFHRGSSKKSWLVYHTVEKAMARYSDAIITINSEDFSVAQKMPCKKAYHINGVGCDTSRYTECEIDREEYRASLGLSPQDFLVLDVGELSDRKNHGTVIDAVASLKDPDIVLFICGKTVADNLTYQALQAQAEASGARVEFLGHRADIPQLCRCADMGVLASKREGLGLSGVEMLASGLPLVTSNVQGIMDYMIEGETGYTYSPMDTRGFAEGIRRLKADPALRDSMREACVRSALRFDNSVSHAQMRSIYGEILGESNS